MLLLRLRRKYFQGEFNDIFSASNLLMCFLSMFLIKKQLYCELFSKTRSLSKLNIKDKTQYICERTIT
jgi:hypothetical protein